MHASLSGNRLLRFNAMASRWILLVELLLAINLSFAQTPAPNLQGFVYDSQHNPVEGATVSAGASARASKLTDLNGHFSLEMAPTVRRGDSVRLHVEKSGFRPSILDVGLSDLTVAVYLVSSKAPLPPKPSSYRQPSALPLWKTSDDAVIDSVQTMLNAFRTQDVTNAQIVGALRGLFDAPVFSYLGEELPEDALYRFCRNERILLYYMPNLDEPSVRAAISTASQNLIYLQDIFGALYGPAFSAKEQCDKYGDRSRGEYKSHLGPRIIDRNSLDAPRAEEVMTKMLTTLASIGMASPPKVAPSVSPVESAGKTGSPVAETAVSGSADTSQPKNAAGQITGRVTDGATNRGLLNSLVSLENGIGQTFTDGNGRFTLLIKPPIPKGPLHVSIAAEEYEDYGANVEVGQNIEVALVSAPIVLNPPVCTKYDHGLRHFYWYYIYDDLPARRRKDWYQESPTTWNECYYDGTHNRLKVVDSHANLDGNDGVICKDDSHPARIFIPNEDADGVYPHTLRFQTSAADPWSGLATLREVKKK
jgi:hypothetical protein